MNYKKALLAIAAASVSMGAWSASMLDAMLVGQAQQQITAGEVSACGVTIVAVELPQGIPTGRVLLFNGSVMVYGVNGGLVKGRVSDMDAKSIASGNLDLNKLKTLESTNFWMKAPSEKSTEPLAGQAITNSDDPGYKLYIASMESTLGVIDAILDKKAIQVGFKTRNSTTEQVLFGVVTLSNSQEAQLQQCLAEWSAAILKKHKGTGEGGEKPAQ